MLFIHGVSLKKQLTWNKPLASVKKATETNFKLFFRFPVISCS